MVVVGSREELEWGARGIYDQGTVYTCLKFAKDKLKHLPNSTQSRKGEGSKERVLHP